MKPSKQSSRIACLCALFFLLAANIATGQFAGGFSTPVWDSTVLWSRTMEHDVGSGAKGWWLDGPAKEMIMTQPLDRGLVALAPESGPYGAFVLDSALDRFHLVTGSTVRGYLDGPFSRARFADWWYMADHNEGFYKEYLYFSDPGYENLTRLLNLKTQRVSTVKTTFDPINVGKKVVDSAGNLYIKAKWDTRMEIVSLDGTSRIVDPPSNNEQVDWLCIDPKHNRLYVGTFGAKQWYVFYWDLADFSVHGVLPKSAVQRDQGLPGPFEGMNIYPQMRVFFGPDDPDYRFLYVAPNDMPFIFKLDLDNKFVWASSMEEDGLKFISSGTPKRFPEWKLTINQNGDFFGNVTDGPAYNAKHRRIR